MTTDTAAEQQRDRSGTAAPPAHARRPLARRDSSSCSISRSSTCARPATCPPRDQSLAGRTVANLFFEPEHAHARLVRAGRDAARRRRRQPRRADRPRASRARRVLDTIYTLQAMQVDVFVMRDAEPGVPALVARHVAPHVSVLNAGEAHVSHPTQGLLDALTIRQRKGDTSRALRRDRRRRPPFARRALGAAGARRRSASASSASSRPRELMPEPDEFAGRDAASTTLAEGIARRRRRDGAARSSASAWPKRSIPDAEEYFRESGITARAPRAGAARRDRDAPGADEPRRRDRERRGRRPAVGDPAAGDQRRRGAHGGARASCAPPGAQHEAGRRAG